jgi:hypothetical protein
MTAASAAPAAPEPCCRSVKQRVAVMLGFKKFRNAAIMIAGIELIPHIRKGQFDLRHLGVQGGSASGIWKVILGA